MTGAFAPAVASGPEWTPPPEFSVPPLDRNPFYEDAARRIRHMLPELAPLSPSILGVIDLALHEERTAWRARFSRPDKREVERRG